MANKIIHKHSSVITDGKPKLPTSSQLEYGELAINYAKDNETISLKNNENEIVEFKSTKYLESIIKENEEIIAASLTDLDERVSAVDGKINENNEAISASLNDLNERFIILDADLSNMDNRVKVFESWDFATESDIDEILNGTYTPLPEKPNQTTGTITENNSIVIDESQLENGTYTLKYIDSEDNVVENFNEITTFEINK